ncbi:MAG: amphi-Trp domain-containing protein [Desulfovibrio sp.]|nr:MAG: amphi-Trp domain-containing protein [Desulfovibrio sp.]
MSSKNKVEIEGTMELTQVATYLEDLLKGIKAGTVHVQLGGDSVLLHPKSIVDFEMEVTQKKEKEKITLEMSWKTDGTTGPGSGVTISSSGPTLEIS